MKHIKEWNWNQIGWRILQAIIIFIANGGSFAWLIMNFYGDVPVEITMLGVKQTINVAFWDTLDFKWKALVYGCMVIGVILSILWIKLLWKNKQAKKDRELEKEKNDKLEKLADKIIKKSEG